MGHRRKHKKMPEHCEHCGCRLHVVKGTTRHYGNLRACSRIQELQKISTTLLRENLSLRRRWRDHTCL